MTHWYEEAFDEEYLALYPHRDDDEARRNVEAIDRLLRPGRDDRILDLACGAGRHLAALREAGFTDLTGIDLSEPLLAHARRRLTEEAKGSVRLVRTDMREIPFRSEFAIVLSLFTSFGYFEAEDDDLRVLRSAFAALRPGGVLLVDLMNPVHVASSLVREEEKDLGALHVAIRRSLDPAGRRVEKETTYDSKTFGRRTVRESVRLYRDDEIAGLLARAGFDEIRNYGSLSGDRLCPTSSRLVSVARKGKP